ncbi:MAG: hypothetical protein FWG11_02780 [Promicromonosporaceae bacterium]|nr:hypothetical protein [Promicromonosporaceae bacterium]
MGLSLAACGGDAEADDSPYAVDGGSEAPAPTAEQEAGADAPAAESTPQDPGEPQGSVVAQWVEQDVTFFDEPVERTTVVLRSTTLVPAVHVPGGPHQSTMDRGLMLGVWLSSEASPHFYNDEWARAGDFGLYSSANERLGHCSTIPTGRMQGAAGEEILALLGDGPVYHEITAFDQEADEGWIYCLMLNDDVDRWDGQGLSLVYHREQTARHPRGAMEAFTYTIPLLP